MSEVLWLYHSSIQSFIHSFIQQMCAKCLLWAKFWLLCWKTVVNRTNLMPILMTLNI